jgi:hypothetical protein
MHMAISARGIADLHDAGVVLASKEWTYIADTQVDFNQTYTPTACIYVKAHAHHVWVWRTADLTAEMQRYIIFWNQSACQTTQGASTSCLDDMFAAYRHITHTNLDVLLRE